MWHLRAVYRELFMKIIKKLLSGANRAEELLAIIAFSVMIMAAFAQTVNRNIFMLPIGWLEELSRYSQILMVLLATEMGLRDGTQMSITAVTGKLKGNAKKILAIVAKLVVTVFVFILFIKSLTILSNQISYPQVSPGLKVQMYIPYFALPLAFGIASAVQMCTVFKMIRDLFSREAAA